VIWRTAWSSSSSGGPRRALAPEQRHDAVTPVLVDCTFEAVNAFGQDLEEAIHDAVPILRVEVGGELRRSPDVGEQDRHLLALAFKSAAGR
jgi:hypothetical protein